MYVTIVIPVHNEEENLEELTKRIKETIRHYRIVKRWEILFIDDKSTDNSLQIIKNLSKKDKHIRYCAHKVNRGQAGAFETGIKNARGDVIVTIDADLQVYPEDIPLLLDKIYEGYELVNAIRRKRKDAFLITVSSKIYNILMKLFFNSPVTDAASNFTAFLKKYAKNLKLIENDHRYIIPILQKRGLKKITEVPVRHRPRERGKSKYSLMKAVTGFPELIRAFKRIKRGFYD